MPALYGNDDFGRSGPLLMRPASATTWPGSSARGWQVLTTGPQLRAARSMAALTRDELALAASVGPATVTRLEPGRLPATLATLDSLTRVLEAAGVQFTEDGVRAAPIPRPRRK